MPKADTKKLKSITEFIWLFYPKATFSTLSVSGELPASRLPRLPWLKIPRQNLTSQTILKYHTNHDFLHFSPKGTVPRARVGEWTVRFSALRLEGGTPARASPSATRFARGIPAALHEKHNTRDSEYILSKNENGFTRYKV